MPGEPTRAPGPPGSPSHRPPLFLLLVLPGGLRGAYRCCSCSADVDTSKGPWRRERSSRGVPAQGPAWEFGFLPSRNWVHPRLRLSVIGWERHCVIPALCHQRPRGESLWDIFPRLNHHCTLVTWKCGGKDPSALTFLEHDIGPEHY